MAMKAAKKAVKKATKAAKKPGVKKATKQQTSATSLDPAAAAGGGGDGSSTSTAANDGEPSKNSHLTPDLLSLPYGERRIVAVFSAEEKLEREAAARRGVDKDFKRSGIPVVGPFFAARGLFRLWKSKDDQPEEGLGVREIELGYARDSLEFVRPHPISGYVYVGHPLAPPRYIPFSAFHNYLFEEKVQELLDLLAALGATRVSVSCEQGRKTCHSAEAGLSIAGRGGGASGRIHRSSQRAALFEEEYLPRSKAALPDGLVWFGAERSWQSLAKRRLERGTKTFAARLAYTEDFGINAEVKTKIEGLGLKLGGGFENFESTVWKFSGEFAPLDG